MKTTTRWITEDGREFGDEDQAAAWEAFLAVKDELDAYLEAEVANGRARATARRHITGFLLHRYTSGTFVHPEAVQAA